MSLPIEHEEWRPVVGYEGLYEVSDQGRVRSVDRLVEVSGPHKVRRYRGRVRATHHDTSDRETVSLKAQGVARTVYVHTLVLTAFGGARPPGCNVLHYDGNASNNRLENLRWGSQGDNLRDAVRHNTHAMARKTKCPQGHSLREPNLVPYLWARGKRSCLACSRARGNEQHARDRNLPFDFALRADDHYVRIMNGVS